MTGTYAAFKIEPESAEKLSDWLQQNSVVNPADPESFHITTVYSRNPLNDYECHSGGFDVTPLEWQIFGQPEKSYLVLIVGHLKLDQAWNDAKEAGASWDYPSYEPHISVSQATPRHEIVVPHSLPDFSIRVAEEYSEPLDPLR